MIGIILPFGRKEKKPEKEGNRDKFFKGQQYNEEVVCFFRKHWITILPIIGMAVLLVLAETGLILGFSFLSPFLRESNLFVSIYVALVIGFTIYLHKIFLRFFAHFMDIYIFTNLRIIDHRKTVILSDSEEMLDIVKIQDIQMSQDGLFRNILGYGDLVVTLSSSKASRRISYVPNVNFHYRCLNRIKRTASDTYNSERAHSGVDKSLPKSSLLEESSAIENAVNSIVNSDGGM